MFIHDTWFSRVVVHVAEKYGIQTRLPLSHMTEKQRQILLYGTGDELHRVVGQNRFGDRTTIEEQYPGIVAELKRRYLESESDFVRSEIEKYMREEVCSTCRGKRLKQEALTVTIDTFTIADATDLSITDCLTWVSTLLKKNITETERAIALPIVKEITSRLSFLHAVGLDYLTLARGATTLSGGEAQRIKLASELSRRMTGNTLYILDEPTTGLHFDDVKKLLHVLHRLVEAGNTVIVIEHNMDVIKTADWIIDLGPEGGDNGGRVVVTGPPEEVVKYHKESYTGKFLREVLK